MENINSTDDQDELEIPDSKADVKSVILSNSHGSQKNKCQSKHEVDHFENHNKCPNDASYSQRIIVEEITGKLTALQRVHCNPVTSIIPSISSQERMMRLIHNLSMNTNFNWEQMSQFLSFLHDNRFNSLRPIVSNLDQPSISHIFRNNEFKISMSSNTDVRRWFMVKEQNELLVASLAQRGETEEETNTMHYSHGDALSLMQKLEESTFENFLMTLRKWLEQGVCNAGNADVFYNMIQRANCHVGLLMNEVWKREDELNQRKLKLIDFMEDTLAKLDEIEKVFHSTCMQNISYYITQKQKRHIKLMKDHCGEFKNVIIDKLRKSETDEASEESKNEQDAAKKKFDKLQEENRALLLKLKSLNEQKILLQSQQNKQMAQKRSRDEAESEEAYLNKCFKKTNHPYNVKNNSAYDAMTNTEKEAHLIGLIAKFLNLYPSGASLDTIIAYLKEIKCPVKAEDIENLIKRFPTVFLEVPSNGLEKKIKFLST